jgi:hypothetical protein
MGEELFADVASMDFLGFDLPGTNYKLRFHCITLIQLPVAVHNMLAEQQAKTGKLCGVECFVRDVDGVKAVWLRHHDFGFFGGSLGCAEEEGRSKRPVKLNAAFRLGVDDIIERMTKDLGSSNSFALSLSRESARAPRVHASNLTRRPICTRQLQAVRVGSACLTLVNSATAA